MAKLQPVLKSEIYLTEVQHVGAHARYLWSSYIYDPPNDVMTVAVTGFANPTNNVTGEDITSVNLASGWFETPYVAQVPEVAPALARASTPTTATCAHITRPLKTQSFVLSQNMNGCNFHQKSDKPKTGAKSRTQNWTNIMGGSVFDLTRSRLRHLARLWKDQLSAADRAAWEAFAATATLYSYDGGFRTPNGYEAFIKVALHINIIGFNPYTIGLPNISMFAPTPPTGSWSDLGTPAIGTVNRYGDGAVGIQISNTPAVSNIYLLGQIAKQGTPHTRRRSWFSPWEPAQSLDQYDPTYETEWQVDFPLFPPLTDSSVTLALFFFDADSYSWGDYSYGDV